MIAKRIRTAKGKSHNMRNLGNYVRDAGHGGEKCLMSWFAGCDAPDYDSALMEIEATQAMNLRCRSNRAYHLVISFRPEDEDKLTPEAFRRIEEAFAGTLGLSEHQRLCGVHKNTNNLHLHIAYNLIHPETFTTATSLHYDYQKLAQTCRALEREFSLAEDSGAKREATAPELSISQRAAAMEAHSGEQSFQSYALGLKDALVRRLDAAATWEEAHGILAGYGMAIRPRGNGLALVPLDGQGGLKASALDRSLSRTKLEKRFGAFAEPQGAARSAPEKQAYDRKPKHPRSPERDRLYKDYQAALAEKIARIDAEKARTKAAHDALNEHWRRMKADLCANTFSRRTRAVRLRMMRDLHVKDVVGEKAGHKAAMAAIKADYAWYNWNTYLQDQVKKGNTAALAVLRSQEARKAGRAGKPETEQPRMEAKTEEKASPGARLARLAEIEARRASLGGAATSFFAGHTYRIDNRGVVIITLASCGIIRDAGDALFFSREQDTRQAARLYAQAKFGKAIREKENSIERREGIVSGIAKLFKPHIGILKECARHGLRPLSQLPLVFGRKKQPKVLLPDHAHGDMER